MKLIYMQVFGLVTLILKQTFTSAILLIELLCTRLTLCPHVFRTRANVYLSFNRFTGNYFFLNRCVKVCYDTFRKTAVASQRDQ